jgi:hypothetical protein
MQLFSPRMEPVDAGHQAESGYAMYAGCVRGSWFGAYGLTVGHLFDAVGTECQRRAMPWFPFRVTVGKCALKIDSVDLKKSIRRTTADVALIQLTCPTQSVIHVAGRDYRLRLYRGKLCNSSTVAIVTKDGAIRLGHINNSLFTIDRLGLFNTMSIVDLEQQSTRLNDSGDSGALVTSVPGDSDEIFVYGMVIGYYESFDGTLSNTVATRLCDVLECIAGGAELDFDDLQMNYSSVTSPAGDVTSPPSGAADSGYTTVQASD